jgi:hypothetical protein
MKTAPTEETTKSKLRHLRDRLAVEAPRARVRPSVPPDLIERLDGVLEFVSRAYLVSATGKSGGTLQEMEEDALAEGYLALSEWDRWLEREKRPSAPVRPFKPAANRREHERVPTTVTVKLLRLSVSEEATGGMTLDAKMASRPARNVSLGGIFVSLPRAELPEVRVGNVLHVLVAAAANSHQLRGVVMRRDDSGIGLRWIIDNDRTQKTIDDLLTAAQSPSISG